MNDKKHDKRKTVKPIDIVIIIVVLLSCVIIILFLNKNKSSDKSVAVISYNGQILKEIDLSSAKDQIFTLEQNKKVNFQISDGKIRFVQTQCPDKLCENVGYISRPNQVAICMPNKVTLKIVSRKNDFDIVVN